MDTQNYVIRKGDMCGSGRTKRAATIALEKKIFESKSEAERINDFVSKYAADDLHTTDEWIQAHKELTGSCTVGAYKFIRSKGIKRYEKYTTIDFLNKVDGFYGGGIISKVKKYYDDLKGV